MPALFTKMSIGTFGFYLVDSFAHLVGIGHIKDRRADRQALRFQGVSCRGLLWRCAAIQHHMGTGLRQSLGQGQANAGR